MQVETVVVVAGGEPPAAEAMRAIPPGSIVIAADRGLDHARALGIDVEAAVGDFDSASPEAVAAAERAGTRIERHAESKDATDLELALDVASALEPKRILVLAGGGGRLDHLLSALLLLASPRYAAVEIDACFGDARVHLVRDERELAGEPGELVTLLAVNGPAEGVETRGLAYPLTGETLEPGSSRGVSNVFAGETAQVRVGRGVVLAIRPGAGGGNAT
jgi:thiamine pyrophosphokinase